LVVAERIRVRGDDDDIRFSRDIECPQHADRCGAFARSAVRSEVVLAHQTLRRFVHRYFVEWSPPGNGVAAAQRVDTAICDAVPVVTTGGGESCVKAGRGDPYVPDAEIGGHDPGESTEELLRVDVGGDVDVRDLPGRMDTCVRATCNGEARRACEA
jgi:hypothetical protein